MTKKLFIGLFLVCFVLVPIVYLKADSGRESKQLPPQEVEIMYSSEDHAYQMKDINDVVRFKVLPDGSIGRYDSSGNTSYQTDGGIVSPTFTAAAGYTIVFSAGNIWGIDLSVGSSNIGDGTDAVIGLESSGVTVALPTTITTAMDGKPMTFIITLPKGTAGTTNMVLWAGATATSGVSIENSTGVTNDALDADAEGDSITLIPSYSKQIYFYQGSRIQ